MLWQRTRYPAGLNMTLQEVNQATLGPVPKRALPMPCLGRNQFSARPSHPDAVASGVAWQAPPAQAGAAIQAPPQGTTTYVPSKAAPSGAPVGKRFKGNRFESLRVESSSEDEADSNAGKREWPRGLWGRAWRRYLDPETKEEWYFKQGPPGHQY